jgi:hypothetical protein
MNGHSQRSPAPVGEENGTSFAPFFSRLPGGWVLGREDRQHPRSKSVALRTSWPARGRAASPWFFLRRPTVGKKLYVGNLPYGMTDSDVQRLFEPHGTVQSAQVIMDRDTGRSKGFGFVEMATEAEAQAAIAALNGQDVNGRPLTVNEARPREDRGNRGRSGGGYRY